MRSRSPLLLPLALLTLLPLLVAPRAFATTTYAPVFGTDFSFTNIPTNPSATGPQETSTFGDPEPLFGQPTGLGNQLVFAPTTFSASSTGGGVDQTGSHLQLQITSLSPLTPIRRIVLEESGTSVLTGAGTAATGAMVTLSGFLTVIETVAGAISPVTIPFSGTFAPSDLFLLPADAGTTLWSAVAVVDVESVVAGATRAILSLDNDLVVGSESNTTATLTKDAVTLTVIPEPGSFALLAVGLLALARRKRGRRGDASARA